MEENKQEKGTKSKPNFIIIVFIIIAIILAGSYFYMQSAYISTDDAYVETITVQVLPKVSGRLAQVSVNDNQHVKIAQRIPAKIIFTDIAPRDIDKIIFKMSVVPKVKIRG